MFSEYENFVREELAKWEESSFNNRAHWSDCRAI